MIIKFVDLFAGIGGIRLGFEEALDELGIQHQCIKSCEIDDDACNTYELNFNENPKGDVRELVIEEDFDFLLAGFPCQPFSYAGKQKGFGDTRGTLFFEIQRILEEKRPKGFLLENVRGLTSHDGGKTFKTILAALDNIGYKYHYVLLNSSQFAVPQNRVRLYIIGLLGGCPRSSYQSNIGSTDSHDYKRKQKQTTLDGNCLNQTVVGDILEKSVDSKYYCSEDFNRKLKRLVIEDMHELDGYRLIDYRGGDSIHSWQMGLKGECTNDEIDFMNLLISNRRKHEFGTHQDGKKLSLDQIRTFYRKDNIMDIISSLVSKGYLKEEDGKYNPVCGNMSFEVFKILDPNSISITLTSTDSNRLGVVQCDKIRHITPRECARIQGFPDTFNLNPDDRCTYKQMGNSVSVPVVKAVIKDMFEQNPSLLE